MGLKLIKYHVRVYLRRLLGYVALPREFLNFLTMLLYIVFSYLQQKNKNMFLSTF